ncbi:MAG: LapA family protein [Betaproteobacteria bacterium]|nr:LapA family protein [Betaproteobacteria bacterium]
MRFATWTVRLLIFLTLLAFAVKNTDPVTLRFYFELAWQAPLIVLLLAFFATGAVFGLAAALATLFNQRREIQRLTRALKSSGDNAASAAARNPPPGADV